MDQLNNIHVSTKEQAAKPYPLVPRKGTFERLTRAVRKRTDDELKRLQEIIAETLEIRTAAYPHGSLHSSAFAILRKRSKKGRKQH